MGKGEITIFCTQGSSLHGHPTGAWVEEIAAPYYTFKDAGYSVSIYSPAGGPIPYDKNSLTKEAVTPLTQKFLDDEAAKKQIEGSKALKSLDVDSIVAFFAAGGHGSVVDFDSKEISDIVTKVYSAGKVVSSVCHGAVIFRSAKDANGEPLVKGKRVTGFSSAEETQTPFKDDKEIHAPEVDLVNNGGKYSKAKDVWGSHVEVDTSGTAPIVTGQNPGSSEAVAEAIVKVLQGK